MEPIQRSSGDRHGATLELQTRSAQVRDVEMEWFQLQFDRDFHTKLGINYQDWVSDLLAAVHPGDFQRVRPYGKVGDEKCDGYILSSNTLFQSYAPRQMNAGLVAAKIKEDFTGAQVKWPSMKTWVFVHNDRDGLPTQALKELIRIKSKNPKITLETWSYEELKLLVSRLPRTESVRLFSRPPQRSDFDQLGFQNLASVLSHVKNGEPKPVDEIRPVSPKKIEANSLSGHAIDFLMLGRQRDHLVEGYFARHHNPAFGDEMAATVHNEYIMYRDEGRSADSIFANLRDFIGGNSHKEPADEAAVFALMSYFFQRCDIFEPPKEVPE